MKILLINNDSMVKKLFEAVAKKLGMDLITQANLNLPNAEDDFFLFIDDSIEGDYSSVLSSEKTLMKTYLHKRNNKPVEGFEFYIKKPFLPTEVLDILKRRLADFGITEATTSDLTKDDLEDIPEYSFALDDFNLDEADDLGLKDIEEENKGPRRPVPHISDNFNLDDLEEIQNVLDDVEKEKKKSQAKEHIAEDIEDLGVLPSDIEEEIEEIEEVEEEPDIDEILKGVKSDVEKSKQELKEKAAETPQKNMEAMEAGEDIEDVGAIKTMGAMEDEEPSSEGRGVPDWLNEMTDETSSTSSLVEDLLNDLDTNTPQEIEEIPQKSIKKEEIKDIEEKIPQKETIEEEIIEEEALEKDSKALDIIDDTIIDDVIDENDLIQENDLIEENPHNDGNDDNDDHDHNNNNDDDELIFDDKSSLDENTIEEESSIESVDVANILDKKQIDEVKKILEQTQDQKTEVQHKETAMPKEAKEAKEIDEIDEQDLMEILGDTKKGEKMKKTKSKTKTKNTIEEDKEMSFDKLDDFSMMDDEFDKSALTEDLDVEEPAKKSENNIENLISNSSIDGLKSILDGMQLTINISFPNKKK